MVKKLSEKNQGNEEQPQPSEENKSGETEIEVKQSEEVEVEVEKKEEKAEILEEEQGIETKMAETEERAQGSKPIQSEEKSKEKEEEKEEGIIGEKMAEIETAEKEEGIESEKSQKKEIEKEEIPQKPKPKSKQKQKPKPNPQPKPKSSKIPKKIYKRNFSVTVRCSMKKLGEHFQNLPESENVNFKESPFKHFLNLQTREIHMVTSIITQIMKSRVGRLKYNLGGVIMQFKPIDFTLNLGLKVGRIPNSFILMDSSEVSEFREKYFEKKAIKEHNIMEAIEKARIDPEADKDDIHRLNRLLLLAICLLPDVSQSIDVRYVDLASNLAEFDVFPWGSVVFNMLERALETSAENEASNKHNYNLPGCILAFIIWAYTHIPCLGPRRLADAPPFPRMLGCHKLPGKTTCAQTIDKLIYPTGSRVIEVAAPFLTPGEQAQELVVEAQLW